MRYSTEHRSRRTEQDQTTHRIAHGLGIFSIALGAMEVLAGGALARAFGLPRHESLLRTFGVREIATGIGILSSKDPTPWIWGRVFGDGLDLGVLAPGLSDDNPKQENVLIAVGAVLGATAMDIYCARQLTLEAREYQSNEHDYSDRSGLPESPEAMRGAARDFAIPSDMRGPEPPRPYNQG